MRVATYNVEWFSSLFGEDSALLFDDGWSARYNITRAQQLAALGTVFRSLDADAIMVIEAPDTSRSGDTVTALENLARHFDLRARRTVMGFANDTQQEIALMYDPACLTVSHAPRSNLTDKVAPRFDGALKIDLDVDSRQDTVTFSKPPLELDVTTASGFALHMIGAHLKSKAPHGAKNDAEAMRISIANRRKQLAQAIWLRRRLDHHGDNDRAVMVLGDLNDGPGLDEYEHLFGRSSVEILMGDDLFDPHAQRALSQRVGAVPTTARFWIRQEKRYLQALLDYIFVSPALRQHTPKWRIWHPLDDPECWGTAALRDALVTASDHFPVTIDIDI